jgi:EAL domain-containing protein (putative c-di-GMP-specific phosphodiesterase class I)
MPVAVNASMHDLHDVRLPELVAELLAKHAVPAQCLEVEITEGAIMGDPQRAIGVLARVRELGVRVAVDDFGTGYSSMAYLGQLPIDELKIDRSFVRELSANMKHAAIVRSTIALGHELGLTVVAEGIEDREAWELLRRFGCDLVQGYFVSRPLPAAKLGPWLEGVSWMPGSSALAA